MKLSILLLTLTGFVWIAFAGGGHRTPAPTADAAGKIPMDAKRWYQVVNASNGLDGLHDGILNVSVNTGWGKLLTNYDAYYPLLPGEQMTIERIRFYDGEGTNVDAPLTLSIINEQWQRIPIARFIGDRYMTWVGPDPARPDVFALDQPIRGARYLVINTSGAYPNELELYGTYQPGAAPTTAPVRATPFRQLTGVNAFEWNIEDGNAPWQIDESRIPPLRSFAAIRHYIDWSKLEDQPGLYTFNPTANGSWTYDLIYERMQREGITVLACIKTIPTWLQNTYPEGQRDYENTPARYGSDLLRPQSYVEQARLGFQFAARYGTNKNVNPALVSVSPTKTWAGVNQVKIGLGLIRYIECENERDKTWKGRQAYQRAREYAANLSAFYDGHKNSLGPGVGVKNADPSMTVVMGGLANSSTDYVRGMIDWCREFRGLRADGTVDLCWDVINQHLYANDAGTSQGGGGSRGAAPEVSGVGERAAAFVQVAHELAADRPVWITEAGYDTNPGSPFRAVAIGNKSVEAVRADWVLRTSLLYARLGIDRLFFYQATDENPASGVQFSSMGLINDRSRKPASDFLYQTNQLMGGYAYRETLSRDPIVDRYEGKNAAGQTQSVFVLVVPDERGRTATYDLPVPAGDSVYVCTPVIGRDSMARTLQVSRSGSIRLTVGETPSFVVVGRGTATDAGAGLRSLRVYPNPTTGEVTVSLTNDNPGPVQVIVYDAAGRRLNQVQYGKADRTFEQRIDWQSLPDGAYLLDVRQGNDRAVRRIIRAR